MDQYNRIADAILTLDTMAERISIMESEPERSKEMRRLLVDNYSVFFASIIIEYYLFVIAFSLALNNMFKYNKTRNNIRLVAEIYCV